MTETIIIILIVAVAGWYAGRGLWRSIAGLLGIRRKNNRGSGPACACSASGAGCTGCPMANTDQSGSPDLKIKLHRSRHG